MHNRDRNIRPMTAKVLVCSAVLAFAGPRGDAVEVTVRNDSFQNGQSAIVVGGFIPGEHAGARLTSPCNGTIVAVQIGWLHGEGFPDPPPSVERAIHIYDGATFPMPGSELERLESPVLTSGFINEFRFVDEQQTIPLSIPVVSGQQFYVTLEFENAPNINNGDASIFRDLDGCQTGKNVLFAIPGGWQNFCIVLVGDVVIRAVIDCDELSGACCLPSGDCEIMTATQCAGAGGIYRGDQTDCAAANCPEPIGACCFPQTGACLDLLRSICEGAGGIFQGPGTDCATTVCFPRGACCLPDGTCLDDKSPEECQTLGGVFQGDQTLCAAITCPDPIGACCLPNDFCIPDLTEDQCGTVGGSWAGPDTNCDDNNGNGIADVCELLKGDMNCDGRLNGADIDPFFLAVGDPVAYVIAFPNCEILNADMNLDGRVNGADIDPFFACLAGGPCPPP